MAQDITTIGIEFDTSGLKKGTQALNETERAARKTADAADAMGKKGAAGADQYRKEAERLERQLKTTEGAQLVFNRAVGALAAIVSAGSALRLADDYNKLNAQLKLATKSQAEYEQAILAVQRISKTAQADIGATGALYARLSQALSQSGASQRQVADITEAFALSLKVSGATAAEAASAITQFSQAMASGVLRGEEFNAIAENNSRFMRLLANSVEGAGGSIGALRKMAEEGKLTSDVIGGPLLQSLGQLREEAQNVSLLSGAFTQVKNEVTLMIGKLDQAVGVTRAVQAAVGPVTDFIKSVFVGLGSIIIVVQEALTVALRTLVGLLSSAALAATGQFGAALERLNALSTELSTRIGDAGKRIADLSGASSTAKTGFDGLSSAISKTDLDGARLLRTTTGLTKEQERAAKEAQKRVEAEAKLRAGFAATIADEKLLLELLKMGTAEEEARLRIQLARQGATGAEIDSIVAVTAARQQYVDSIKTAREQEEAEIARRDERLESMDAVVEKARSEAEAVYAKVEAQKLENETIGLTGVALAEVTAARLREQAALAEAQAAQIDKTESDKREVGALLEKAKALRELADLEVVGAVKRDDIEKAKDVIREQTKEAENFEKVIGDIGKSLTDSLFRGFESGKGFARNLRDSVVNLFKTTLIRIPLQGVVTGIAGSLAGAFGFSSAANAAGTAGGFGGGFIDALSGGKTAFDLISGNFTSGLSSIATSLGNAGFSSGASFVNGFASALNGGSAANFAGASSAFNLGNFAGQAAPFVPAVLSLLQGDLRGAAFSGGGAAIGTALGGPIGGIVGSALGSLLGGLFGGGGPKAVRTSINETAPGEFERLRGKAGFLDKGQVDPTLTAISRQFRQTLEGALRQVGETGNFRVGVSAGLFDDRSQSSARLRIQDELGEIISELDLKGSAKKLGENLQKLAQDALGKPLVDAFVAFAGDTISAVQRKFLEEAGKDAEENNARLNAVLTLRRESQRLEEQLGLTADEVIRLADASGSIKTTMEQVFALVDTTPDLRSLTRDAGDLAGQFAKLGVVMPTSVAGLQGLIRGIDASTDAGRNLVQSLLGLAPALTSVIQQAEQLKAAAAADIGNIFGQIIAQRDAAAAEVQAALDREVQSIESAAQAQIDALRDSAGSFREFAGTLRDTVSDILGIIAAQGDPAPLRATFADLSTRARLGDPEALERLPAAARALAAAVPDFAATREESLRELALIAEQTGLAADTAERQGTISERQLEAIESQTRTQVEQLRAQVGALLGIDGKVLSLAEATAKLQTAQAAADQATAQLTALGLIPTAIGDLGTLLAAAIDRFVGAQGAIAAAAAAAAAAQVGSAVELQLAPGSPGYRGPDITSATIGGALNPDFVGPVPQSVGDANAEAVRRVDMAARASSRSRSREAARQAFLGGLGVRQFATGGVFGGGGIVSRPTAFDIGVMGEAGREAIMPLANVGGSLGVRAVSDPALLSELRALREEVSMLRAEARATAVASGKTADLLTRATDGGNDYIQTRTAA